MNTTTTPLPLKPGTWVLDPMHSAVNFTVRHLGISKVRGQFAEFEAGLVAGPALGDFSVTARIALASIDTGNAMRDEHVRSPELLDVARRPTMTFVSTRVEGKGDDWTLDGELTIGDVTRPVSLEVEFGGVVESAVDGKPHAGFEARGKISRRDYGLTFGAGDAVVGDAVTVVLDMQFIEPEEG
ncbi:YceI family protein [Spirillospora sp. CA-294931]|uniref:YceI family protein n=1 Tax=Spirillospora sp. CA-294931 TaxID=3240042 RepID=UPI003D8CBF08